MSLRHRLAIAFLLLSALPLAGFAVYSYSTSRAALAAAARVETENAAQILAARVDDASQELGDRFRQFAMLNSDSWSEEDDADGDDLETVFAGLAPALAFVEDLRFVPSDEPELVVVESESEPVAAGDSGVSGVGTVTFALDAFELALPKLEEIDEAERTKIRSEMKRVRSEMKAKIRQARSRRQPEQEEAALAALRKSTQTLAEIERLQRSAEAPATVEIESATRIAAIPRPPRSPEPASPTPEPKTPAAPVVFRVQPLEATELSVQIAEGDEVVGRIEGRLNASQLLHSVLEQTDREGGEIPFVLDAEGRLYTAGTEDEERLESLEDFAAARDGRPADGPGEWVVITRSDPTTGARYGIARPLGAAIAELRSATARNFGLGLGLVALAFAGFFPLTRRIVHDARELEAGAVRLADGDLSSRVPVRGSDELGRVAGAFNRMAEQIADHQDRLLTEERRRKEDELSRRLLAAENERRGRELEEARDFQLSLLPRELPTLSELDLAVEMTTATEVGGDYYDFQAAPDGSVVMAIGDATGHGAAAGTLVTAVKSLFAAAAVDAAPAAFLTSANAAIHRMGLVRRAMALAVGRIEGTRITVSAAGMPPILHFRAATGQAEEIVLPGTPLGARAEFPYSEVVIELDASDCLLFASDGLPELPNLDGEPFGYERLRSRFAELAPGRAADVVGGLRKAAAEWRAGSAPVDDLTLLVLRRHDS
jgi:serine phosphatase RsbU (regulator of sigma subunit)